MEKEQRPDKQVYNYTEALNQPVWVQKITDRVSLPYAVKMSTLIWLVLFVGLAVLLCRKLGEWTPLPLPFWLVFGIAGAVYLSILVADLKIDEKNFVKFFVDYLIFYFRFGRKAKMYYFNNGLLYRKQKQILEREVKRVFNK
ncbi:conjugal transfer protein [Streptococcus chenjunshii]|uniref:Conjugal transfer protein n=1 Tax=Streptococcus chenjunshii TaxID=2173853 RepID=A0A372KKD9_9STRE|nr:conjugal transfer protein [Streptococcus chenjunshii]AXQ77777.1 conjugal transfer protein [Streptococcus chenjunshii]RFU50499.1 conjugal transfer protein [Streptococcus chenjunshii]RFU52727.1 conjugal transfer protein [Streptococcus chenjunshii]